MCSTCALPYVFYARKLLPKVSSLTTGEVVRESTHSNFPSSHRNESPSSILPILDDKERARKRHWGTIMGSNEPVLNPAAPWSIVHASEYANIRRTTPPRAPSNRDDIPDFSTEEKCTNHLTGLLDAQPEYQPSSPQTSPQPTLLPPCLVDLERRNGIEFSSTNSIGFPVEIKKSEDLTKKITKRGSRGSSFTEGRSDYKKETDASSEPKLASSGSFQCPKCAHLFRRKYDMRSHISAVHDKRRPHRCPYVHICSSSFAHRGTMTKHISTVLFGFVRIVFKESVSKQNVRLGLTSIFLSLLTLSLFFLQYRRFT